MAEPTVDLNLGPSPAPQQQGNPLGMASGLAGLQSQLNANKLFAQQFEARQQAGAIIAGSKDWDDAATKLKANPLVAGFIPEIAGTMLVNSQTNQQIQGLRQGQASSALEGLWKGLATAASDPGKYDAALKASTAAIPGPVRDYLKANGDPIGKIDEILRPLAKDPEALQRAIAAGQLASGIDQGKVFGITGRVAPTLQSTAGGGAQVRGGFEGGGSLGTGSPGGAAPPPPGADLKASDGKALALPSTYFAPTSRDAKGLPLRSSEEQEQVLQTGVDAVKATRLYDAAAQTNSSMETIKSDIQEAARGGGWTTPGFGGTARMQIGNAINTLSKLVNPGATPPVDPAKLASAEGLTKESFRAASGLMNQAMGGHESFEALHGALSAVPGLENSPLGGMLLAEGIQAGSKWLTEKGQAQRIWGTQTRGDYRNFDNAWREQHPPEGYMEGVLAKYGMGPKGFLPGSQGRVKEMLHDGLLTPDMARSAIKKLGLPASGGGGE